MVQQWSLYFRTSGKYFGFVTPCSRSPSIVREVPLSGVQVQQTVAGQLAQDMSPYVRCSYSRYRSNFVTVAGVVDVWPVIVSVFPVPAGKGEDKQNEGTQHHDAPAEVERQVI